MQYQNPNPNQKIQMIYAEQREPHIIVVMRGGVATPANHNTRQGQPRVRPTTQNKAPLDFQKEKEVFLEVRPKFVDTNQPSTYGKVNTIPERFEQLIRKPPMKKVSKLKEFLKSCLVLINDKDVVTELTAFIEETT